MQALVEVEQAPRTRLASRFIDNPWLDWVISLVIFSIIGALGTPSIPLDNLDAPVRFSVYAGLAAAILAFVTVAFTPLAILVALADTPGVRRLRKHDDAIRRQFLRATLLMVLLAATLLVAGAFDAAGQSVGSVRFAATVVVGIAAMKMVRLTALFWAILAAGAR